MPDEVGTEATRSEASSVDDDLFGDAAVDKAESSVEGEDASGKDEQAPQGSDDATEAEESQETQDSGDSGEPADAVPQATADADASTEDDLKVVVSIKGGRTTIGVQRPSADPHIETFDDLDETGLTTEVPAVIERARARWEETPKHPAYERPAPPARRRNRRQQGTAQDAAAETQEAETQQQTLRLF